MTCNVHTFYTNTHTIIYKGYPGCVTGCILEYYYVCILNIGIGGSTRIFPTAIAFSISHGYNTYIYFPRHCTPDPFRL